MSEHDEPSRNRIYLSYRRSDSTSIAIALKEGLTAAFPSALFRDEDDIDPGEPFPSRLMGELDRSAVIVALIGPTWLHSADDHGRRRLDLADDWVRQEIAYSLRVDAVKLIPVLVDSSSMPTSDAVLPTDIAGLCEIQALRLRSDSWGDDLKRLKKAISSALPARRTGLARHAAIDDAIAVYEGLGYQIDRAAPPGSPAASFVATMQIAGSKPLRLLVTVGVTSRAVHSPQNVATYLRDVDFLLRAGIVTACTLVTTSKFSDKSRQLVEAQDQRIDLITLEELRRQETLDEGRLREWVRSYEASQICRMFIDVKLNATRRSQQTIRISDLSSLVEPARSHSDLLVLLADFGGGKTTALQRLKYLALRRLLVDGKEARLPVLFQLKTLRQFGDLDAYIADTIRREIGQLYSVAHFWESFYDGRLLVLLDGFDEIAVQPNEKERTGFLATLSPIMFGPSPALITSRPSYFANTQEYERQIRKADIRLGIVEGKGVARPMAPNSATLFNELRRVRVEAQGGHLPRSGTVSTFSVAPLDGIQVREYIKRLEASFAAVGIASVEDVVQFLDSVYDLSDLVTRPILLQMITETILRSGIDIYERSKSLGPADLYDIYTRLHLVEDIDKNANREAGIGVDDRMRFAEECAALMSRRGILEVGNGDARRIAEKIVGPKAGRTASGIRVGDRLDRIMTDLRTCSFLTTNDEGSLRFIHKSFFEYFLASRVRDAIVSKGDLTVMATDLPSETLFFLGSMTMAEDNPLSVKLKAEIEAVLSRTESLQDQGHSREAAIRSSALGALAYGRMPLILDLIGGQFPAISRADFELTYSSLDRVSFPSIRGRRLALSHVKMSSCDMRVEVDELSLVHCSPGPRPTLLSATGSVRVASIESSTGRVELSMASSFEMRLSQASIGVQASESPRVTVSMERSRAHFDSRLHNLKAESSVVGLAMAGGNPVSGTLNVVRSLVILYVDPDDASGPVGPTRVGLSESEQQQSIGRIASSLVVVDPLIDLRTLALIDLTDSVVIGGHVDQAALSKVDYERARRQTRAEVYLNGAPRGVPEKVNNRAERVIALPYYGLAMNELGLLECPVPGRRIQPPAGVVDYLLGLKSVKASVDPGDLSVDLSF